MKKILLFLSMFIFNNSAFCEDDVYFENINDTIFKFYFNEFGKVSTKSNATYYRTITKSFLDNNSTGEVRDYYLNNCLAFVGYFKDGYLIDTVRTYYENNNILSVGRLNYGNYTGEWTYYYNNGKIRKILSVNNNHIRIIGFNSKNGKAKVIDGNGTLNDDILINSKTLENFQLKGDVKNGVTIGNWVMYNNYFDYAGRTTNVASIRFNDIYDDQGNFIKGNQYFTYTETYNHEDVFELENNNKTHNAPVIPFFDFNPHIVLNISGTYVSLDNGSYLNNKHEKSYSLLDKILSGEKINNILLFQNTNILMPSYDKKQNLNISFLNDLVTKLKDAQLNISKGILYCQFKLDKKNQILNICINSSSVIDETSKEKIISIIKGMEINWESSTIQETKRPIDSYVFISIVFDDGVITTGCYNLGLSNSTCEIFHLLEN